MAEAPIDAPFSDRDDRLSARYGRRGERERRRSQSGQKETEFATISGHRMRDEPATRLEYVIAPRATASNP
jgi:hypothetical protein